MEQNNQKRKMPDAINCSSTENYTRISNDILQSNTLSGAAVKILGILLSKKEGERHIISVLKTMMKEKETVIRRGLKELENLGYIKRDHKKAYHIIK